MVRLSPSHATMVAVNEASLSALLADVRSGALSEDDALAMLRRLPFADIGVARIDHHRSVRQGLPEAVYGPGKSPEACVAIVEELLTNGSGPVLVTRTDEDQRKALFAAHKDMHESGSLVSWRHADPVESGSVAVITAGTADAPVADEAAGVLSAHGRSVDRISDVGVAGIHRILGEVDRIVAADVVIVVAGMEGALASVVGGLCAAPVVAVPTSVGYGSGLDGVTALLSMQASCAAGVTVVGIDNGYGAAVAALRVLGAIT
jgi:NCAIR mutase (PurE)-related protein